jgi:hypothetical protein
MRKLPAARSGILFSGSADRGMLVAISPVEGQPRVYQMDVLTYPR